MAEFTNANIVTVAAGQNVPLTETAVNSKPCIVHRAGAGLDYFLDKLEYL